MVLAAAKGSPAAASASGCCGLVAGTHSRGFVLFQRTGSVTGGATPGKRRAATSPASSEERLSKFQVFAVDPRPDELPLHPIGSLAEDLEHNPRVSWGPPDHGSWAGSWPLPSSGELADRAIPPLGSGIRPLPRASTTRDAAPSADFDVRVAQKTARKEFKWAKMFPADRVLFQGAADKHWKLWNDRGAVDILPQTETEEVRRELARRGELDRALESRFVRTDKKDGLRTEFNPLPVEASARLVVRGFKDRANIENELRRGAPTEPRNAQHMLFVYAGADPAWILASRDVRAAFLTGDPYVNREP